MKAGNEVDLAWLGDAVLALYARKWILEHEGDAGNGVSRSELYRLMTSNQFLSCLGKPTEVEAEIGCVYEKEGLEAAFEYLEEKVLPVFVKQLKNKKRGQRGQGGKKVKR